MAEKKDPTVRGVSPDAEEYPEGTHPAKAPSEVTHAADKLEYRDLDDDKKPDPTTVAQEQVVDEEAFPS